MSDDSFLRGAVRPIACLQEGWRIVKPYYWTHFGITLVGLLVGSAVPFGILWGPMACGIYLCLLRDMDRRDEPSLSLLFKGFDYFYNSLIATLLMIVPIMIFVVPAAIGLMIYMINSMPQPGQRGGPPPDPTPMFVAFGGFYAVLIVVSLVVQIFFFFVYQLIVDRKLAGGEAVRTSAKAAMANFGGVFGLTFLIGFLSVLGLCCCYVGAFLVMPVSFASMAVAYRQAFPEDRSQRLLDDVDDDDWGPSRPSSTDYRPSPSDRPE